MKKLSTILLIIIILPVYSQVEKRLLEIVDELQNITTLQSTCTRSFSMPYGGDTLTYESFVTVKDVPEDGFCGYYYDYTSAEVYQNDNRFMDFYMYFDSAVYKSYLGKVEKVSYSNSPSQFISFKLDNRYIPAIHESGPLNNYTPKSISLEIVSLLNDSSIVVIQLPDTIVEFDTCGRFFFRFKKKINESVKKNQLHLEMCFNKTKSYLVYYKRQAFTSLFDQINEVTFRNTIINQQLSEDHFSEENLLPTGWENTHEGKLTVKEESKDLIGTIAPKWKLPMLGSNKAMSNRDLKGKYTLIEFTATWCGACYQAAKMMNRLEERYKDNDKVEIISIYSSSYDKASSIELFAEKHDIILPVLYEAVAVGEKYKVHGYPDFFIISPNGTILDVIGGYGPGVEDEIIEELTKLTSE